MRFSAICGLLAVALLVAMVVVSCCSPKNKVITVENAGNKHQAKMIYYTRSQNTSYMDQNGNLPEPKVSTTDTVLVNENMSVAGFKIIKITETNVTIESEYFEYFVSQFNKTGKRFVLRRGDSETRFLLSGLLDASQETIIRFE